MDTKCSPEKHERRWQQVIDVVDEGPHVCVANWLQRYDELAEGLLNDAMVDHLFNETKRLAFAALKDQLHSIKEGSLNFVGSALNGSEKESLKQDISALFPDTATYMPTRACVAPVNILAHQIEGQLCVNGAEAALKKIIQRKDIYEGQPTTIQTDTGPRTNFGNLPFLGRLNELVKAVKEATESKTRLDKTLFIDKIAAQSHGGGGTVIDACMDRGMPYLPIQLASLTREVMECVRNDKISEDEGIIE